MPEQMPSYNFPSLVTGASLFNSSAGADADFHCVAFQLDVGLEVELFGDSNGVPPEKVFQLAWALVLACFVERNETAFGFVNLEHGRSTRQNIRANIDRDLSASEAVHVLQISDDEASFIGKEAPPVSEDTNTLLRVSRDNEGFTAHQRSLDFSISNSDAQVSSLFIIPA